MSAPSNSQVKAYIRLLQQILPIPQMLYPLPQAFQNFIRLIPAPKLEISFVFAIKITSFSPS